MSEHNQAHAHNAEPVNPLTQDIQITRNDITATLGKFVGKRNEWKDKPYQAFQLETDGTDEAVEKDNIFITGLNWIGKNNVKNYLNTILKRHGQDFVVDSLGAEGTADEGIFSLDKFITFWTNLKSSALRLSELNDTYQEEVAKYQELTNQLVALLMEGHAKDSEVVKAHKQKVDTSSAAIKTLQAEFDERKARKSKEAQAETVAAV